MVDVPAGPFKMGSDDAEVDDIAVPLCKEHWDDNCTRGWFIGGAEQPQHEVDLGAFYIDKKEVTNERYRECVEAGACRAPSDITNYANTDYAQHPVVHVKWNDADTYCRWMGKRLPTEAEWEKAARGPEGRVFPWGDEFDGTKLNYCDTNCEFDWADKRVDDGYADTAPVGYYPAGASWCDALDMAGNVWEWTADLFKAYPDSRFQSKDPDRDSKCRVLRGGSWGEAPHFARGSNRKWELPEHQEDNAGFRCAMDAE
jgi:formylglycine-generating enzyme required for sulfatase activity